MTRKRLLLAIGVCLIFVPAIAITAALGFSDWALGLLAGFVAAMGLQILSSLLVVRFASVKTRRSLAELLRNVRSASVDRDVPALKRLLESHSSDLLRQMDDRAAKHLARYDERNRETLESAVHQLRAIESVVLALERSQRDADMSDSPQGGRLRDLDLRTAYGMWVNTGGTPTELSYAVFRSLCRATQYAQPDIVIWGSTSMPQGMQDSGAIAYLSLFDPAFALLQSPHESGFVSASAVTATGTDTAPVALLLHNDLTIRSALDVIDGLAVELATSHQVMAHFGFRSGEQPSEVADYLRARDWYVLELGPESIIAHVSCLAEPT